MAVLNYSCVRTIGWAVKIAFDGVAGVRMMFARGLSIVPLSIFFVLVLMCSRTTTLLWGKEMKRMLGHLYYYC